MESLNRGSDAGKEKGMIQDSNGSRKLQDDKKNNSTDKAESDNVKTESLFIPPGSHCSTSLPATIKFHNRAIFKCNHNKHSSQLNIATPDEAVATTKSSNLITVHFTDSGIEQEAKINSSTVSHSGSPTTSKQLQNQSSNLFIREQAEREFKQIKEMQINVPLLSPLPPTPPREGKRNVQEKPNACQSQLSNVKNNTEFCPQAEMSSVYTTKLQNGDTIVIVRPTLEEITVKRLPNDKISFIFPPPKERS